MARSLISRAPATVHRGMLAAEALRIMEERHISALPVLDESATLCGVINLLGLLEAGLA